MHSLQETKEFISTLNTYKILMNEDVRERFIELYYYIFEEYISCTGCASSLEMAMMKFNWVLKKHNDTETLIKAKYLMKYKMQHNARVYSFKMNMVVTPHNCTDEVAELLMNENPKYRDLFILNPDFAKVVQQNETYSVQSLQESTTISEVIANPSLVVSKNSEKKKRGRKPKK